MSKLRPFLLFGCLSLLIVVPALAQQVDSLDFKNTAPAAGTITCDVNAQQRGPVRAISAVAATDTKETQAENAARAICAVAGDCVVANDPDPLALVNCGTISVPFFLDCPAKPKKGFRLGYGGGDKITAQPTVTPPNALANVGIATGIGGLEVGVDLAEFVQIRVNPNGNFGDVSFRFFHSQGGANPRTAKVTTAFGKTDEKTHEELRDDIIDKTSSANPANDLKLNVILRCQPSRGKGNAPEFKEGCSLLIVDPNGNLTGVTMQGQTNQRNNLETGVPRRQIPTLNTIGLVVFLGLLLLTGVWFLRRRQRLQQA